MMTGVVNAGLEPLINLTVYDNASQPHGVEAVIDTGCNGFLTLPASVITALGLTWISRQDGELADGSVVAFDVYEAKVEWNGQQRDVEVDAADAQPLIGMAMMHGSELRIKVVVGGHVAISPLP